MSLFKAREWWSAVVGEEEQFDHGCLCVGNIDSSSAGLDKIIVGSYHGFVRIFNPRPVRSEGGWSGYRPEDVLCETQLQAPVLQVEVGRFVSGSENLHLAVLHPRKFAVFSVVGSVGAVEHGSQYALKMAYEHNLQRTSFNFCYGPFGGIKGRDFLCIQSMDGTVSVYEQESFAFSRFLPGALLPGPIKYVPRTDSFVTVSSSRQLESYKYQVLAVASDAKTKEESQNIKSGKRVAHDWTINLGEQALDICVTNFAASPAAIFVLGERSIFCGTETGKLKFMKKFEFSPSCFLPYAAVSEATTNCLVGTHTKTLLVYQDVTLKWAAQLTQVPVQVKVANLQDMKGAIVTLDEEGHLHCSYMGTDPAMFSPPSAEVREIDYAEQDREMRRLQKAIKEQQHKATPVPSARPDDEVQLVAEVPPSLDSVSQAHESDVQDEDPVPSLTVKLFLKSKSHINNVRVSIHSPPPLMSGESLITFPSIDPARPAELSIVFYLKNNSLPSSLTADATVSYQSASGAPRVVHTSVKLPLKLVMKPVLPVKNANFKITIDTNKPPVNLNDIFPDLLGENAGGPGNALGFQYIDGATVTILASKTSQRYRLQCDDFEGLWMPLNELVNRLTSYHQSRRQNDFQALYDGSLPLQEYFDVIDQHFQCRLNEDNYKKLLSERATQFRAIQRRLLMRFKDKTPAPLSNLDTLLDGTYRQLLALADAWEHNRGMQEKAGNNLSSATYLINLLMKLWTRMSEPEFHILQAALSPDVCDNGEQGWEEMVDAAITHLLRTCLAKSAKDQTVNPSPLGMLKDTQKLKKHIALMVDRIGKGAALVVEGMDKISGSKGEASQRRVPPSAGTTKRDLGIDSSSTDDDLGEAEVPTGSKLGESKKSPPKTKELPPLNGSIGPPKVGALPPLGEDPGEPKIGGGSNYLKKKPSIVEGESSSQDVPDLDDMGSVESDGHLMNGEMVYGL